MKAYNILTLVSLALCPCKTHCQLSYGKKGVVSYSKIEVKKDGEKASYSYDDYVLELRQTGKDDPSLVLSYKKKVIQQFTADGFILKQIPRFAQVADLNGDGIKDLKIILPSDGASPLAREASLKVFLLSKSQRKFNKLSFFDCSNAAERDLDGDGRYEIFSRELQGYKGHSYWKHEIYSIKDNTLKNVSLNYNYPILIRIMTSSKFNAPLKLNKEKLEKLCSKLPQQFEFE